MINSLFIASDGKVITEIKPADFPQYLARQDGIFWVDFEDTPPEEDFPILSDIFHFHHLAIEDALRQSHIPKLDDWEDYLYIVLHAVHYHPDDAEPIETLEIDFFLGDYFLVTHHEHNIPVIENVRTMTHKDSRFVQNGADYLFYKLTEAIVLDFLPIVEELDEQIDQAEDAVFGSARRGILEHVFRLKRSTVRIRRILGPQREVLNRLARDEFKVIEPKARIYFRDVYDHLVRLFDIIETVRDLIGGVLDSYLSVINNRMNEIMKTLTVITTFFMPLSFITGFFGMNFFGPGIPLPEWTGSTSFWITLGIIALTPIVMYLWMRRRRWM